MGFKTRGGRFSTSAELDALYAQGFPHLRILTDEVVEPKVARREAKKALEAVDPYLPTHIPRDVARRYLRGYIVLKQYDNQAAVKVAIADDEAPIDKEWLEEILARKIGPSRHLHHNGETYDFRMAEVIFIFEAFLGTEVVAESLVRHLVGARDNPRWWGDAFSRDHQNGAARRLVPILGWLRLRMAPARWRAIISPLAGEQPSLPRFVTQLAILIDDTQPLDESKHPEWLAMQRRDQAWLGKFLARYAEHGYWYDPQIYYVVGAAALDSQGVDRMKRLPKWLQLRIIDELGTIRDARVTRVIAALLESRSAGEAAASWLAARGQGGAQPAARRSPEELQRELTEMIKGIGGQLRAQHGDVAGEEKVMEESYSRYCEIRAALDDVSPEAYFTHHLADVACDWDTDEATTQRWIDMAVAVA